MNKKELIESLKNKGFDKKILNAFNMVRREDFIPGEFKECSYEDNALLIGKGQTISQPYTIAFMLNLLELKDKQKILEVGSGSGYVLALINKISKNSEIYGIERIKELSQESKSNFKKDNVKIIHGNALELIKGLGKFDRILVSASADKFPITLIDQLKDNGFLVIPIKNSIFQIRKTEKGILKKEFPGFVFVPLIENVAVEL